MQQSIKKKSKKLITIKTNNFIQLDNQKQLFFAQVLQQVQKQFQPDHYNFLITCIFSQNNTKKFRNDMKYSQKKIYTQPQQRECNIADIDANIFHQPIRKNVMANVNKEQNKQNNSNTNMNKNKSKSKKVIEEKIVFENKRIFDLDKKLQEKYSKNKVLIIRCLDILAEKVYIQDKQIVFYRIKKENYMKLTDQFVFKQPKSLFLSKHKKINNYRNSQIVIKSTFKNSLKLSNNMTINRNNMVNSSLSSRQKILRRLKTEDNCIRDDDFMNTHTDNNNTHRHNNNAHTHNNNNSTNNNNNLINNNNLLLIRNPNFNNTQIQKSLKLNFNSNSNNNNMRQSEYLFDRYEQYNYRQKFIPKQLITDVILSRRTKRNKQNCDFSDLRLSQRYRKCFM